MDLASLQQHSSNPLEAPASDARFNRCVLRHTLAKDEGEGDSEGDCEHSSDSEEVEHYHTHVADLRSKTRRRVSATGSKSRKRSAPAGYVDLDSSMSEDEDVVVDTLDARDEPPETREDPDEGSDMMGESGDEEMDIEPDDEEILEENSILLKSHEERMEVLKEMVELERAVPDLAEDYSLIDRLGTGTFSAVYKAIDLGYHDRWDNGVWLGKHLEGSSAHYQTEPRPPGSKVFVAVKRIYVTSGPERIRNELSILEDCRGCRHVCQLITAFRNEDQVVAIMPYHKNDDFREFFRVVPLDGIKSYFRCMFRALRDIHARGIIHRDVKPANFLFDARTGIGTLCDFGLACRMEKGPSHGQCLHTPSNENHPHGKLRELSTAEVDNVKKMQRDARVRSTWPSERVGYPKEDARPHSKANRAGTRGFRAPEVLLKCGDQTGAIDVWSAGMILLFFLTGKFPILQANDDVEALVEISSILGRKRMERTATLHSRTFQTNMPCIAQGMTWTQFVEANNPDVRTPRRPDGRFWPYTSPAWAESHPPPLLLPASTLSSENSPPHPSTSSPPSTSSRYSASVSPTHSDSHSSSHHLPVPTPEAYARDIDAALDLLEGLMEPESVKRITPRAALAHPFLRDPDEPDDDEFAPHRCGEGVCERYHKIDRRGEHSVYVRNEEGVFYKRRVQAGEGVCIGRRPCEFHAEGYEVEFEA